ncbi:2OG-Fe(II) oxygenase [Legionella dresdenensis]|uniref:2OG-Fe(II) oxygenase n=1 Tax=Legionella dresdenensis TaxID=450200 RepID=A0ABV8CES7_9GAMM
MLNFQELIDHLHDKNFYIAENFLPRPHAVELQEMAQQLMLENHFRQAKVGSQNHAVSDNRIRSDVICWLEENDASPAVQAYFSAMNQVSETLNRELFLGLASFESHFACYKAGTFYKKHSDQFQNKKQRRISCVYYLNQDWQSADGGELKIYNPEDQLLATVQPHFNHLVCFTSNLPHEVCTTHKTRLSIAGWFKTRDSLY